MNSLSVALRAGYSSVRTAEGASEKQSSLKARLRNGLTYLLTYLLVSDFGQFVCWNDAAPDDWTIVPLLVKMYKLVINELSNQIEKSTSTRATTGDEDEVLSSLTLLLCIF